jgi:hypothetical protein
MVLPATKFTLSLVKLHDISNYGETNAQVYLTVSDARIGGACKLPPPGAGHTHPYCYNQS